MKKRNFLIIYAVIWIVTVGLILFRFNLGVHTISATSTRRGAAVMWFMIFYGPFFFVLYLMTGFLIDVREQYLTSDHFKGYLQTHRFLLALFLVTMFVFALLNAI